MKCCGTSLAAISFSAVAIALLGVTLFRFRHEKFLLWRSFQPRFFVIPYRFRCVIESQFHKYSPFLSPFSCPVFTQCTVIQ